MSKTEIPSIRFHGFDDAWEQRKVSELFRVTRGYVLAATQTETTKTDEKPYPVYSSQTKDKGLMGYYKDYLYEDAITWTTDGANAGTVNYRAGKFYCTNVCGVLLSNEVKANQMIAEALDSVAKGYVSYVGNPKLMNNVMADIVIQIPTQAEEREQLSSFFAKLDNLITLHQRKFEKLTNVKKSMLKKMFPQNGSSYPEIRFKGFTDPWEQRKFSDVVATRRGLTYKPSDIRKNGVRVLRSSNIAEDSFVLSDEDVFVVREAVNIDCVRANDILITAANGSSRLVGKHTIISGIPEESAVHGGFMLLGTTKEPHFVNASMGSSWYRRFIELFVAGGNGAIGNLNKNDLDNQDIAIPSEKEQKQIGSFFRQLDNLITLHQRELEKLQSIKKALLEKMFV